jgi:hypothetical protein
MAFAAAAWRRRRSKLIDLTAAGQRRSIQLGLPTAVGDGRAGASAADDFRGGMKVRIAE